jgi:hypothetical protein
MAEEFVDIEQNGDPLGILSKKTVSPKVQEAAPVDSDPLGILKKKSTPVVSSGTPSQLPSQPDFLQQGQKVASGEIFTDISKSVPKPTLKEAAIKDRSNNNSYLGAVWNNIVASAERLAGGAARLAMKMDTSPISRIQETADKAASSVTGINYEAIREKESADKFRNFIGKARTASSSKEYEKGLAQGFDVTDGIGLDDLKGLGAVLPSMLADMALAVPTAGTSFAIQGYDDALSIIDNTPEAKNMSETTRTAFGLGGGVIAGVLEKLGMNNILKSGTATRYVTSKILKEASEEIAKKGVKVTAEQFQKAVSDKATQMLTKTALKNTVKAGTKSALFEGATEATQEGAMDLMKLAANQIENKNIFDEEELKNTAASRYLNSAVMGGIFGGVGGGAVAMSRIKNLQRYIQNEIKNAKTQQDIDNLVNDINQNVQEGVLSQNDAEVLKSMVDENISKPSDLDIKNEKEAKLSEINGEIALLNKEDRLYNENLENLNKRKEEVNSYYDNLAKESRKLDEVVSDDGTPVPMEEAVTEVKITEEVKPTEAGVDLKSPEKMNASQNRYGIVKEGKDAGFIVTSNPKDGVVKVQGVTVNEDLRGKGLAGEAYVKLGNDLAKEGISLASDSFDKMEPSAKRVWDKLVDRGLAEKGENNYELKKPEAEVKPTEVKTVEQLRTEEQAEYDSMTDPNDAAKKEKIYEKYDKLISPLLEGKKQEAKPTEVKVTEEVKPTEENRFYSEDEMLKYEKDIQKKLDDYQDDVEKKYLENGNPTNESFKKMNDELNDVQKHKEYWDLIDKRDEFQYHNEKVLQRIANDTLSGFGEISEELKNNLIKNYFKINPDNKLITQLASSKEGYNSLLNNLNNESLPRLAEVIARGRLKERGLDFDGVFSQISGWSESQKQEFLKENAVIAKKIQSEILNNIENAYKKPSKEAKPTEAGAKEGVPSEAKPSEPTKSERQAEYEKIKSNKKKKDFVRNNLPEEFKPLADELTNAQMSKIVESNFDLKTIKDIQDAVQKQSAAEILQPKQEEDGGAGGGRERVEQGKQGNEPTGESKAKATEEAQPKGAEEGEVIGITHEQLNEVARELGFPEYEASPETVEQWDAEAREDLKDPEYANRLIAKYEKGDIPKPREQRAMLMIISSAKAKINANPTPENLAEFKRIMELSNNIGGRLVGQTLVARKGVKQVEDTLPDFLLMRENDRGYPFTESEIKEQAKIFEELKKEKDALKEALQKSEEANAKLIAEMGVNKAKAAAKKAAKKTREEYVIERKQSLADAREALRKLRTGEQGVTAVVVPGFRELKAVSPHVKNYIKSLVEEGANKLDDIVNDTYAEFKDIVDGITKKDILDIFNGEYDESKPRTRNEKAEELRLLQKEAALLKELENVRKGIEKEKNPAQKVKKNDRIIELEDKIKEVKRLNKERDRVPQEFTESEFASKTEGEALASKRRMLTKRIEKLQDDIKNKRYLEEKQAPPKLELDRKTQLLKDRVIKMERQIEAERQKDAYKKMSKTEKAIDHINQITGIRRVMQTAFDLSVSLRQGIMTALNFRKWDVFSKSFTNQMKSVFSDKKFNSLMYDIRNSGEYNKMQEDGIKFNELDSLKNEERNEDFQKSFLYGIKIPIVRQLITEPLLASQRAADGFLNTARYELYLKYEKQLLKQGITRQSDPEAYKKMADLVMNMTGRGKLVSFLESGKANKVVSNTFYGARLMAANINSLNPVKYAQLPPGVRKEVMKDVLSIVTTTTGIMLAASAAGATVEMDPDKPDFLQIRFGEKVYDITGGKAAYLRTFFRMVSALYSRVSDNKYNQEKKLERAGSSLVKFFRNKLAPNTGFAVNAVLGKNTLNQDFDPYEVLEAYPMYADDFAQALKDEGVASLATVFLPNILGIGYGSYATQANKESLETSLERMLNSDEMNPELIKNHKDGDRLINEKEFDELAKLRDAKIEKEIRNLYDGKSKFNLILDKGNVVTKKVKDMTEEEVKKAKKSIASEATRLSKEQLFGKEKKTREEKMEDKRLSRARKRFD